MRDLAREFSQAADRANELAEAGEQARLLLSQKTQEQPLRVDRVEFLYEMTFLRVFLEWETFLEQSFLRYLCGYSSRSGPALMVNGSYYPNLSLAEAAVLGNRQFKLWHNPQHVIDRARRFIFQGTHELVIASNLSRLTYFAVIRHRIAHAQAHARREFDQATMSLAARRYPGSKPGRFLRDWTAGTTPPMRWLETISSELKLLASQIVP